MLLQSKLSEVAAVRERDDARASRTGAARKEQRPGFRGAGARYGSCLLQASSKNTLVAALIRCANN